MIAHTAFALGTFNANGGSSIAGGGLVVMPATEDIILTVTQATVTQTAAIVKLTAVYPVWVVQAELTPIVTPTLVTQTAEIVSLVAAQQATAVQAVPTLANSPSITPLFFLVIYIIHK